MGFFECFRLKSLRNRYAAIRGDTRETYRLLFFHRKKTTIYAVIKEKKMNK